MKITPEDMYSLTDRVMTDKELKDAVKNLIKQTEKYGSLKDGVLAFAIGVLGSSFNDPDMFISSIEGAKFMVLAKQYGSMAPLFDLISSFSQKV